LLPSLAETSEVSCAELAAKTLVELAYIVGFTHRPEHSLTLMAAVSEAMRAGMQDYCDENIEAISADIAGDGDDLAVDLDEAEQRHQSIH
jgi:hypothetical protein